ncbi:hypothetical protein CAEBREN_20506 [Caenorhabditis brenneri]|uniref:Uncharacterized protein n=1 Tax=Caenorhabditis brenneri TaxID=135651 RepID=G0MY70_CAEBE|nr:hypothetical protein CAEBREN_20506 [Caenorhabditis brenneri]
MDHNPALKSTKKHEREARGEKSSRDSTTKTDWHVDAPAFQPAHPSIVNTEVIDKATQQHHQSLVPGPYPTQIQQPMDQTANHSYELGHMENSLVINSQIQTATPAHPSAHLAYCNISQTPTIVYPATQQRQQFSNGMNGIHKLAPGVMAPMNPGNGPPQQPSYQVHGFPSSTGQFALYPGYSFIPGTPALNGQVGPAGSMNFLPTVSQQQQHLLQSSLINSQINLNATLPDRKSQYNYRMSNQTFSGFEKSSNRKPKRDQDFQQPEVRGKNGSSSKLSYRYNRSLVSNGNSIPSEVTQNEEGLNRIINGLTREVVRLQHFVQVLMEERDKAVVSKMKHQRNTSTQTIIGTEEKEVQATTKTLETPILTSQVMQQKKCEEAGSTLGSPKNTLTTETAGKVSDLQESTLIVRTEASPIDATVTEKAAEVSPTRSDNSSIAEKTSDLIASTLVLNAQGLEHCAKTTMEAAEASEEPSDINSLAGKASDLNASTHIYKTQGSENSENAAKETAEARAIEKEEATQQMSFRRADYADITRLNIPISPAAPSQNMKGSPQCQGTLRDKANQENLPTKKVFSMDKARESPPDGFKYPKKFATSPSLTNEELQKAFSTRRFLDSPVITLVTKPQELSQTTPSKKYQPLNSRKSAKKGAPTPNKSNAESAQDFEVFVSDEKTIKEFSTLIGSILPVYAAKMRNFRSYFSNHSQDLPNLDRLIQQIIQYWQANRMHEYTPEEMQKVQNSLRRRLESLAAKSDLQSQKLHTLLRMIFKSGDNLLSDDVFYLLFQDKNQQLILLIKYMDLITNFSDWEYLLDIPPPNTK